MIEFRVLTLTPFADIYAAFDEAFIDYDRRWTADEFQRMITRRGFRPEISFGAFDNEKLVSMTLNGFGNFNGKKTIYDTGTGTIKTYRGKGLATGIFNFSIPVLKKEGADQYLLEVLQHNEKAISIYRNMGFIVKRELNYYLKEAEILRKIQPDNFGFEIRQIDFSLKKEMTDMSEDIVVTAEARERAAKVLREILDHMGVDAEVSAFIPSWQNGFEALEKCVENFICLGVFDKNQLIGYGITEPLSGDVPQIAVSKKYRRKGIGTFILNELAKKIQSVNVRILNTEKSCESVNGFLRSLDIGLTGSQYEMVRSL